MFVLYIYSVSMIKLDVVGFFKTLIHFHLFSFDSWSIQISHINAATKSDGGNPKNPGAVIS